MKIFQKLFGRRYWFVVLRNRFSLDETMCGRIFPSKKEAKKFVRQHILSGKTFFPIGIHSFRSRYNISVYEEE